MRITRPCAYDTFLCYKGLPRHAFNPGIQWISALKIVWVEQCTVHVCSAADLRDGLLSVRHVQRYDYVLVLV